VLYALSEADREGRTLDRDDLVEVCGRNPKAYQRAAQALIGAKLVEDVTQYSIPPSANLVFERLELTQKGRDYWREHRIGKS
jgi:hypothetical protein